MVEGILTDVTGDFGEAAKLQLPAQQRMMIEQMELPQPMKDALLENNNSEIYHLLGADSFLNMWAAI